MHRLALRPAAARAFSRHTLSGASRRFASTTSPVDKPRSWKSSALRWGLAGGALYYYSTSSVFAEEPAHLTSPAPSHFSDDDLPTVDSILESKRAQIQQHLESKNVVREPTSIPSTSATGSASPSSHQPSEAAAPIADGSPAALEEEAGQQGAFNPETGEINWDCSCLGGMAHGPCGEEFRTAFSCFVFSEVEPKGMDCIDKFQAMQDCFRQHPDVYGAELAEDEEAEAAAEQHASEQAAAPSSDSAGPNGSVTRDASASPIIEDHQQLRDTEPATPAVSSHNDAQDSKPVVESDPIPAKWDDATAANDAVEKVETPKEKQGDEDKKEKA